MVMMSMSGWVVVVLCALEDGRGHYGVTVMLEVLRVGADRELRTET